MIHSLAPRLAALGPLGLPELIIIALLLSILAGGIMLVIFIIKKLSGKK